MGLSLSPKTQTLLMTLLESSKVRITSYRQPADMEAPKSLDDIDNQVNAYASVEA